MSKTRENLSLAEVYEFRSGLSKPRSAFGSGAPFLSFKDVFYNSAVPNFLKELVESSEKEQQNCSVRRGDVFLTRTSETMDELGMSCVALKDIPGATFNGFCKRLRPKVLDQIVPEYARYFFRSKRFRDQVNAMATMSTRASLNNEMLERLEIDAPSIVEQSAIGAILGTLDDKIELNQKMNQTLEEIAKSIFKSWFVDFDPVRAKAEGRPTGLPPEISDLFPDQLVDSEIGEIPKGWESTRISKIAKKVSEKYKKGENWSEEKLIDLSRMPSKSIALNAHGKGAELSTSVCKFKKYDFLFGSIRPYFYKAGICPFDGVSNTSVFILRSIEDFDREFIYLYSSSDQVFEQSIQYSDGTKMPIIKWQDFQDFSFALPDKTLRKHFSEIVRPMVERLICNVEEEKILSELRDTLLPKLISGELRIPDAEKFLEEAGL